MAYRALVTVAYFSDIQDGALDNQFKVNMGDSFEVAEKLIHYALDSDTGFNPHDAYYSFCNTVSQTSGVSYFPDYDTATFTEWATVYADQCWHIEFRETMAGRMTITITGASELCTQDIWFMRKIQLYTSPED